MHRKHTKIITVVLFVSLANSLNAIIVGTWTNNTGDRLWNTPGNWNITSPNPPANAYPGLTASGGDRATIVQNFRVSPGIGASAPITLGILTLNVPGGMTQSISPNNLTFSNPNAPFAAINLDSGILQLTPLGNVAMFLNSPLVVNTLPVVGPGQKGMTISYPIRGDNGITFNLQPDVGVTLTGNNSNRGPYVVNGGILTLSSTTGSSIPSSLLINPGATVRIGNPGLGSNQFGPGVNVNVDDGILDINSSSAQAFNTLTMEGMGRAIGSPGSLLTLLSNQVALQMNGGSFLIPNLTLEKGGRISGSGDATIGSPLYTTSISSHGLPVTVAVGATEFEPFDLAIINTTFVDSSVTKTQDGILFFEGQNTLPSLTINGGRVLFGNNLSDVTHINSIVNVGPGTAVGGSGTVITQVLTNSGTVEPGIGGRGTLTISGSYTQTPNGTLLIRAVDQSVTRLVVTGGGVHLDGALVVEGTNVNFRPGVPVVILDNTAGTGITGTFSRFMENISDEFFAKFIVLPNQVVLDFFASPVPEVEAIESIEMTLVTGNLLNTLSRLRFVRHRMEDAHWEPPKFAKAEHPRKAIALKERRSQTKNYITSEPDPISAGRFWKQPSEEPGSIYIAPTGNWGHVNLPHERAKFHSVGGLIGADYAFTCVGIGGFLGGEHVKGSINHCFGDFQLNTGYGQLYGTFLPTHNQNLFVDLIVGGARNWYTLNRQSTCAVAKGKPKGWEYEGYAGIGYDINMKKEWRLTPDAGIQYTKFKINPFLETGAFDENLSVPAQKFHSLRSWLGATWGGKLIRQSATWMPEVRGYWQHEFAFKERCITIFSPCYQVCESSLIPAGDRNFGIVGAELRALFGPHHRWSILGAYDYYWGKHVATNYLYGELGINF